MTDTASLTLLYGDPALAPPEQTTVTAGPLSLVYTAAGDLRTIRYGKHELLRRIYAAVRADDWWTIPAIVTERERTIGEDSFRIVDEVHYQAAERGIDYRAMITLTGDGSGTVTFDFDGEALSDFERNRIGICVLHPTEAKGAVVTVTHASDGSTEVGAFPDTIAPHQPFFDIAAITHTVAPGVTATVTFSGDVFEMEDQRNWLDASFKTYSTPLDLPKPVRVATGERVRQTVVLTPRIAPEAQPKASADEPVVVTVSGPARELPGIGLKIPEETEFTAAQAQMMKPLRLHHVWAQIDLAQPRWQYALRRADKVARMVPATLYVVLKNAPHYLQQRTSRSAKTWEQATRITSPAKWFADGVSDAETLAAIQEMIPGISLGAGFLSNFTELNRSRPESGRVDALFFGGNPQVHSFDSLSILETPRSIIDTLSTARTFADGKPILVGPLRFARGSDADPRHDARIGTIWYWASLSHAVNAGASTVTLCDLTGKHGVFRNLAPGVPMTLFDLLTKIGVPTEKRCRTVSNSAPGKVAALYLEATVLGTRVAHLYLTNTTLNEQNVVVTGMNTGEGYHQSCLASGNTSAVFEGEGFVRQEGEKPVELRLAPLSICRIVAPPLAD